jgi:glutamate-1-semialdehyde 2,1-aminomutase
MAAGLATLKALQRRGVYGELEEKSDYLFSGLKEAAKEAGVPVAVNRVGSMASLFFTDGPVMDFDSAKRSDSERFKRFYGSMLAQGVYLAPSAFETWFVSTAHDPISLEKTVDCARRSFRSL